MAKVKVEVTGAFVDGKGPGSTLSIEEKSADHLEAIGYVKRLVEEKPKAEPKQTKSKPKSKEK
jgi:hypothetical protein